MTKLNLLSSFAAVACGKILLVQGQSVPLVLRGIIPALYRDGVEIPEFISPVGEIDCVDTTRFYAIFVADEYSDKVGDIVPALNFVRAAKALTNGAKTWGVDTPRKVAGYIDCRYY